jgi:hypothetical protein
LALTAGPFHKKQQTARLKSILLMQG